MNAALAPVKRRHPPAPRGSAARNALMRDCMPAAQRATVAAALGGEGAAGVGDRLDALAATLRRMPRLHETDGQGGRALARMHWSTGAADWWLVEWDATGRSGFGLCDLGQGFGPELGYFALSDMLSIGAELDLHWQPAPVARIRADRSAAGLMAQLRLGAGLVGFDEPTRPPAARLRGDYGNILGGALASGSSLSLPFAPAEVVHVEAIETSSGALALVVFDGEADILALWDGIEHALDRWPDLRTCLRAPGAGRIEGWPEPLAGAAAQARYDALTDAPAHYKVVSRWSADRGLDPREQRLATGPALIWIETPTATPPSPLET